MRHHFFADVILSGAGGIEITEAMPLFYGRSIQAKAAGGEEREKGEGRRGAMGLRQDVVSGLIRDERQRGWNRGRRQRAAVAANVVTGIGGPCDSVDRSRGEKRGGEEGGLE